MEQVGDNIFGFIAGATNFQQYCSKCLCCIPNQRAVSCVNLKSESLECGSFLNWLDHQLSYADLISGAGPGCVQILE